MTLSAIFPTLTSPLRYPPRNLPVSSLQGADRTPIIRLGALSPEARAGANATLERLTSAALRLERDLFRLTNRGDAPSGSLAADITSAANEVEELERNLSEVNSDTELTQSWSEWARGLEGILASLRVQLDEFENATTTTRTRYVIGGVFVAAAIGIGGAYFVFKKGRRK